MSCKDAKVLSHVQKLYTDVLKREKVASEDTVELWSSEDFEADMQSARQRSLYPRNFC